MKWAFHGSNQQVWIIRLVYLCMKTISFQSFFPSAPRFIEGARVPSRCATGSCLTKSPFCVSSLALQLMYACADAGLIFVPLNTRWAINELRHAVIDSGIKVMAVLDREFVGPVLELSEAAISGGPSLSWLLVGPLACDSPLSSTTQPEVSQWREFPLGGTARAEDNAEREGERATGVYSGTGQDKREHRMVNGSVRHHSMCEDDVRDVFCIMHTSGSTGRSKGVALTHLGQVRSCPFRTLSKGTR